MEEQLKPLFRKTVGIGILLKTPKDIEDLWELEFQISFPNESFNTSINEIIKNETLYDEKVSLSLFIKRDIFIKELINSLKLASNIFFPIKRILNGLLLRLLYLNSEEVSQFLNIINELKEAGFTISIPNSLTKTKKSNISIKLDIKSDSTLTLKSLLSFEWKVYIDGELITKEQLKKIVESENPLILWKDKWTILEIEDKESLLSILNNSNGEIEFQKVLGLALVGKGTLKNKEYLINTDTNLNDYIERFKKIEEFKKIETPKDFNGILRPYQEIGFSWLNHISKLNLGMCLADDMGLGKTIQIIAFLLNRKKEDYNEIGSILIICPTSVLYNWKYELNKFSNLNIHIHYGNSRLKEKQHLYRFHQPHQIILTTYGTARNDIDLLEQVDFSGIILDESQTIKNHRTNQAQAIYRLKSKYRIALSGTPIENNLGELWALFNFLNPNLLGTFSEFRKEYLNPIERDNDQKKIEVLKSIISPFILRRLKTDKNIIKDLPDKNEMKIHLKLTNEQAQLYKELVDRTLDIIKEDYEHKRGIVFKLITQLKQICNHPYQYLKMEANTFDFENNMDDFISRSQKIRRLIELVDNLLINNEKALIFTQYTQMGDLLYYSLKQKYKSVLYYNGKLTINQRKKIVKSFQSETTSSPKLMIVSLLSGGLGLNLTKATTVIHIDRWWNFAKEDQATDRTYRIGQENKIMVYKFITLGTIEEKIDNLIERKRDLSNSIITPNGESILSNINFNQLKELIKLDQ
jgi:SNF2 family DNA or RNA helicase